MSEFAIIKLALISIMSLVLLWFLEFFTIAWHTVRGHQKTRAMKFFVGQQTVLCLMALFVATFCVWRNELMAALATICAIIGITATQWAWKRFGNPTYHKGTRFDPWHVYGSFPSHTPIAAVLVVAMTPHHWAWGLSYLVLAAILSASPWFLFRNPSWKAPGWCPEPVWEWYKVWKQNKPFLNPFRVK